MNNGFIKFVEFLKKETNWNTYGPDLALIKPGDWADVIQYAAKLGYNFDINEVKEYFKGKPLLSEHEVLDPEESNVLGLWGKFELNP